MYNNPTTFEISTQNIQEGSRRFVQTPTEESVNNHDSSTDSDQIANVALTEETVAMAEDRIATIIGDLTSFVEELSDCAATNLDNLRSVSEFDELKKEVKALKANIIKSKTVLKRLKPDEDITEFEQAIQNSKTFITELDVKRTGFVDGEVMKQNNKVFSHVSALKLLLGAMFQTCVSKFTVDLVR